ncbi:MAG: hypothetical protein ACFFB3_09115 [Candidatus Hodarchaeota archaeon]
MASNDQEIVTYDQQIERLEKDLRILSRDSCLIILANLMIQGKMIYEKLKEKTGLGKATIFRGLDLLIESNYVAKEKDPRISDKRKNTAYFATDKEFRLPKIDRNFITYLESNGKIELLDEIARNLYSLPTAIMKAASEIETRKQSESNGEKVAIAYSNLLEFENFPLIQEKVLSTIEEIEKLCLKKKREYKEPLRNGIAISIMLVSLEGH